MFSMANAAGSIYGSDPPSVESWGRKPLEMALPYLPVSCCSVWHNQKPRKHVAKLGYGCPYCKTFGMPPFWEEHCNDQSRSFGTWSSLNTTGPINYIFSPCFMTAQPYAAHLGNHHFLQHRHPNPHSELHSREKLFCILTATTVSSSGADVFSRGEIWLPVLS